MNTYTKTCVICPHCGAQTDSTVDHLSAGQSFGYWYCDKCGGAYSGKANGAATEITKSDKRFSRTFDLLVLEPQKEPVYFVMAGKDYHDGHINQDTVDSKRYYYEEHSCPINWIGNASMIAVDGDTDPHGFLSFVRSVPVSIGFDPNDEDELTVNAFPEVLGNVDV